MASMSCFRAIIQNEKYDKREKIMCVVVSFDIFSFLVKFVSLFCMFLSLLRIAINKELDLIAHVFNIKMNNKKIFFS